VLSGVRRRKEFRIRDDDKAVTNTNRNLYWSSFPGLSCLDSPKMRGQGIECKKKKMYILDIKSNKGFLLCKD